MKKKIFIHIGAGKTGTTSIQYMLENSKKKLLENSYFYHTKKYLKEPNHHDLVSVPFDDKMWEKDKEKYKQLKETFLKSNASIMIISTENLLGVPKYYVEEINNMFSDFEIKIIVYVRNQIQLMPSHFLQKQKDISADYKVNIRGFFNSYKSIWGNEPAYILKNWLPVFGKNNMIVKVYDRTVLTDGNVCMDFSEILGITDYVTQAKYRSNVSLLPALSSFVTILDQELPILLNRLDQPSFDFRQNIIMKLLLDISDAYNKDKVAVVNENFERLTEAIHQRFPNIQTSSLYKIFIAIEKARKILKNKEKIMLMDEEFQREVLDYYKEINTEFCQTFFDEEQSTAFLKYYKN